ncbi:MSMEG_0570 family nitrogen starvation response protein [Pantoea osteomyelitidis]|uniref:MSMEG_0570 family nitrogen starvation response protein n=1 Tax=Pantoea osteomyelitidis TaxID=3230026 RepID=A0ABW7PXL7_9GAMM
MPAMHFIVCWPDGSKETCYSPSTTIEKHFRLNHAYSVAEFVTVAQAALAEASDRVAAKFGYHCSSASDQAAAITQKAQRYGADEAVFVETIRPVTSSH